MTPVQSNNDGTQDIRVPAASIIAFVTDALVACGLPPDDALSVAKLMTEADLVGSDAHGVFRTAQYVGRLKAKKINPTPTITVRRSGPATALVDGDNAMGHLVMAFAARNAVELARETGVAWVGARRSNHAGAASIYAAIPLEHDMVGIYAAAAGSNHMAPWGGAEALIGTNPIAVAIPAGAEAPVVLDIATSVASFGKIRSHALAGEPMPEGWVVDPKTGEPITDARRVDEGVLLPIGGYKGSGLSLIIGLLAGPLNAAASGCDVSDEAPGRESNNGQFIIALDVARFLPAQARSRAEWRSIAESVDQTA
jgi:LDH2 family malate/lactate/ureidoglycolate dehydrogenase